MRLLITLWALFFMGTASRGQAPAVFRPPSDSEIRGILVDRIDRCRQSVGIVVGIIEPAGRRIVSYGQLDQNEFRLRLGTGADQQQLDPHVGYNCILRIDHSSGDGPAELPGTKELTRPCTGRAQTLSTEIIVKVWPKLDRGPIAKE